ncbi:unnamed protein product, partial [Ectocarpus sp. 6 AP-2014]
MTTSSLRSRWGCSMVWVLSFFCDSLHANQFTLLPAELFDGLDQLRVLYLVGNNLTTPVRWTACSQSSVAQRQCPCPLPAGIFDDLGRLAGPVPATELAFHATGWGIRRLGVAYAA